MNHQLKPITIPPEQIIAAAQKIADARDDAWEYTEEQWLAATEHWIRACVKDILVDADFNANKIGGFEPDFTCDAPNCKRAPLANNIYCDYHSDWAIEDKTELVMPQPPEWAHDTIITAPPAPRPEIHADEHGDYLYA